METHHTPRDHGDETLEIPVLLSLPVDLMLIPLTQLVKIRVCGSIDLLIR
jgi:hypothetical protein